MNLTKTHVHHASPRFSFTEVQCPNPKGLQNVIAVEGAGNTSYNVVLELSCKFGTRFIDGTDQKNLRCMSDGQWNDSLSSCQGKVFFSSKVADFFYFKKGSHSLQSTVFLWSLI